MAYHLFQDVPHHLFFLGEYAFGALYCIGQTQFPESADDEGLEEFQGYLFGDAYLVEFEFRAYHYH